MSPQSAAQRAYIRELLDHADGLETQSNILFELADALFQWAEANGCAAPVPTPQSGMPLQVVPDMIISPLREATAAKKSGQEPKEEGRRPNLTPVK